ncbi:hypothetical protein [Rhabdothermincola salaria]|uniref:hypothetical protein n=1 Tax=Rhabdothermincola salaria TaxID=2903142 RepID=UPI001E4BD792|nr:hypothetical protein [Rhabdothermincola salaria]MCD9623967.1 hypothetical protein [Rhabdothermincola salaria]
MPLGFIEATPQWVQEAFVVGTEAAAATEPRTPVWSRRGGWTNRRVATLAAAGLLSAGSLGLAACGSDDDAGAEGTTTTTEATGNGAGASSGAQPAEVDQTVAAVLSSVETNLNQAGPDGQVVYGWNHLVGDGTGSGTITDGDVVVDMLGNVDYVDGSGEFFGFITFDFGDAGTLAVRMDGSAQAATDTSDAALSADLEILGGTGDLVDASGTGRFEGGRPERLGGAVEGTYSFDLAD